MSAYVGRFAPSPTGPLHMGSLICAVASYLEARSRHGRWLVRVEDLDPPREINGASDAILFDLKQHGLEWDGPVMWQSQRIAHYLEAIQKLGTRAQVYACDCSRRSLRDFGPVYPGSCRQRDLQDTRDVTLRIAVDHREIQFHDLLQGLQRQRLDVDVGDFIIRRRDGLVAYQLAVVVDDAAQGVTHVVRGSDLLFSTCRQLYLQELLDYPTPAYAHIPLLLNPDGSKYSKQALAAPISAADASKNLVSALRFLGQQPPPAVMRNNVATVLEWALNHWHLQRIPSTLGQADTVLN